MDAMVAVIAMVAVVFDAVRLLVVVINLSPQQQRRCRIPPLRENELS
jgi:hypothetical protein